MKRFLIVPLIVIGFNALTLRTSLAQGANVGAGTNVGAGVGVNLNRAKTHKYRGALVSVLGIVEASRSDWKDLQEQNQFRQPFEVITGIRGVGGKGGRGKKGGADFGGRRGRGGEN